MAISNSDGSIILTTKVDTKGLKSGVKDIKSYANTIKKATLGITIALGTATVALTKMSVEAMAEYEQLIGGIETMFGKSANKLLEYANAAFYTAGLSANKYMSEATKFSASLLQSVGGDVDKAVELTNIALTDMSDNSRKIGTDLSYVQLAYQGFARNQYLLLDNLRLGYGGTRGEMERLLADANELNRQQGKITNYQIDNYGDIIQAIHDIQTEMGIAGTTMLEAEKTILGSSDMVKASWENVLTAISGGGDLDRAINNLVFSLTKYFDNILPVVERSLIGIGYLISQIAPMIIQTVARSLIQAIPYLVTAVYSMIIGLAKGIIEGIKALFRGETVDIGAQISSQVGGISTSLGEATDGMNDLGSATEKAGKKAKKALAPFDDLNILSSNASTGAGNASGTGLDLGSVGGGSIGGVGDIGGLLDGSKLIAEIDKTMATLMGIAGVSLVAIGLILLATGHIGWGVGFVLAGAATLGVALATLKNKAVSKQVKDTMSKAIVIAGIAAIALGVLLCATQKWGLGIGLIALGAGSVISAVALNWNSIKEKLKGTLGKALIVAGVVAIALGVLLCVASMWGPGIGFILTGASTVGTSVAVNWSSITTKVQEIFNSVKTWVKTWGLLVLGIILTAAGFFALGIPLMKKGAANLTTAQSPMWTAIVTKVKSVWSSIKTFWNGNIAKYFTSSWWSNLGRNAINGLLKIVVNGLNKLIGKLNSFGFNLPEILGGGRVGFNIRYLSVPQLAKGAVIPPNNPYLAVVGDQKRGTNIEAPLDTIKQGVAEVLSSMQLNSNGSPMTIYLTLDRDVIGKASVQYHNGVVARTGMSPLMGV